MLVKPLKTGEIKLAETYKHILTTAQLIEVVDVTSAIAVKAAELRAKYNLHTPDAIQIATAIENNITYFVTNDIKLKPVTELNIVTLTEIE